MRPTISQQSVGLIRQGLLLFFRFRRQKTFQHNQCRSKTGGEIVFATVYRQHAARLKPLDAINAGNLKT